MSKIGLVAKKDLKEILQSKGTYLGLAMLLLIFLPSMIVFGQGIDWIEEELALGEFTKEEARTEAEEVLALTTIMLAFVSMMTFCLFFSGYSVLTEKLQRSLESLLATPLTLRELWVGKALAVFLPSALLGLGLTAVTLLIANEVFVHPALDFYVMLPTASLLVCVLSLPAIVFSLVCVTTLLQLILTNSRIVNVLYFVFIFGVAFGLTRTAITITSWNFTLISIAFIAVLAFLNVLLVQLLTTERVILSSKG